MAAPFARVSNVKQNAYMAKTASVTVRIPEALKKRIEKRATREHRSLSAQVEHELATALADEPSEATKKGRFLGMFKSGKVPTDEDFKEVRRVTWARLRGE